MATPTQFNTLREGVDVTQYYAVSASLTPETPAPPFQVGDFTYGALGGEFVFVQASTTINLGSILQVANNYQANGLTSSNVNSSLGCRIATTGQITSVGASLTYIPAAAYFWAQVRGGPVAATQSGTVITSQLTTGAVQLFTTATAGVITSVTTSSTLAAGVKGIECISSTTPLVVLTWPRAEAVFSSAGGTLTAISNA